MKACDNCSHNNKKYKVCTMGIWTAATKDEKAPLGECDYRSKAKKIKAQRDD